MDWSAPLASVDPGSAADNSTVQQPCSWCEHHTEHRGVPFDQADVHRVIRAPANELFGSIERVDEKIGVAVRRNAPGGDFLFGDNGNSGSRARQRREDYQLGRAIGFGDWRKIVLGLDVEAASDDCLDRFARFTRRLGEIVEETRIVDHQRGAIRIPPSSRMAAAFRYGFSMMKQTR